MSQSKQKKIECPLCFGTNIDGFSDTGVACHLCRGEPLSKDRHTAFRLLLPSGVLFWDGGGPILDVVEYFAIIDKLNDAGL